MRLQGVGALYLTEQHTHGRYVLNLRVPGGDVFVPVEGEPVAIVRRRDIGYVQMQHPNARLRLGSYGSDSRGHDAKESGDTDALGGRVASLMREHGLEGELLGVDALVPSAYASLGRAEIPLVDADLVFERAWSVKTPGEIEIYRAIGRQYEAAMCAFRDGLRPGVTENQLAAIVTSAWIDAGGEDIAQLNVCVADNMNPWKRWPTDRAVNAGEFAGVDLHGRGFNGLRGDGSRTFLVGERATTEQRDLYRRAYDYLQVRAARIRIRHDGRATGRGGAHPDRPPGRL